MKSREWTGLRLILTPLRKHYAGTLWGLLKERAQGCLPNPVCPTEQRRAVGHLSSVLHLWSWVGLQHEAKQQLHSKEGAGKQRG